MQSNFNKHKKCWECWKKKKKLEWQIWPRKYAYLNDDNARWNRQVNRKMNCIDLCTIECKHGDRDEEVDEDDNDENDNYDKTQNK